MVKTLSCKVMLLTLVLAMTLLVGTTSNGYAAKPEPPSPNEWLEGPPIVGTLTFELVSCVPSDCVITPGGNGILNINIKFSGCCADCFTACKNSCNVKAEVLNYSLAVTDTGDGHLNLLDVTQEYLEWYRLIGWGAKGCHFKNGGEDLIIENVLQLTKSETNLKANVVILSLCPCTEKP